MNSAEHLEAMRARILAGTQLIAATGFATAFLANRPPGLEVRLSSAPRWLVSWWSPRITNTYEASSGIKLNLPAG